MLTLLLLEPSPVLRQSLRSWLEMDFAPCLLLEADDLAQALTLAERQPLRAILLDLDALCGPDDLRRLRQVCPVIIGLGLDDTPAHRQRAELAGVAAFVSKSQLQTDLARALRAEIK